MKQNVPVKTDVVPVVTYAYAGKYQYSTLDSEV